MQQAACRVDARFDAAVVIARDLIGIGTAGSDHGVHIRKLGLHDAKAANGLIKLFAFA